MSENANQRYALRKIEIVVRAEDRAVIEVLLRAAGAGGWTMISDVAGMGHAGFHEGRRIFNADTGLVMFVVVGDAVLIDAVAEGLRPFLDDHPGVAFFSDVEVMRSRYFAKAGAE